MGENNPEINDKIRRYPIRLIFGWVLTRNEGLQLFYEKADGSLEYFLVDFLAQDGSKPIVIFTDEPSQIVFQYKEEKGIFSNKKSWNCVQVLINRKWQDSSAEVKDIFRN